MTVSHKPFTFINSGVCRINKLKAHTLQMFTDHCDPRQIIP